MFGRVVLLDGSTKDIVLPGDKTSDSDQDEIRSELMKNGGRYQILGSDNEYADFQSDEVVNVTFHDEN